MNIDEYITNCAKAQDAGLPIDWMEVAATVYNAYRKLADEFPTPENEQEEESKVDG